MKRPQKIFVFDANPVENLEEDRTLLVLILPIIKAELLLKTIVEAKENNPVSFSMLGKLMESRTDGEGKKELVEI